MTITTTVKSENAGVTNEICRFEKFLRTPSLVLNGENVDFPLK